MATDTLEERVALLEREVLTLKRQLSGPSAVLWWEQISGVFADVPAFDEAAELGASSFLSTGSEAIEDCRSYIRI